jgi:hypothetical protein
MTRVASSFTFFSTLAILALAGVVAFGLNSPSPSDLPRIETYHYPPGYLNTMGGSLGVYRIDANLSMKVRGVPYGAPKYKFFEFPCPSAAQFEVRREGFSKIYWTEDWRNVTAQEWVQPKGNFYPHGVDRVFAECILPLDVTEDEPFSIWTYNPQVIVPPGGGTVRANTMPRKR